MKKNIIIILFVCLFFFAAGFLNAVFASVMSSTDYNIQFNAPLNLSGGGTSTGASGLSNLGAAVGSGGGISTSSSYKIVSGYQEIQQNYLSVTPPGNINLNLGSIDINGSAVSNTGYWNVTTDGSAGFVMAISASTSPALQLDSSHYFDNYSSTPTFGWSVASGVADFGFTVIPATAADAVTNLRDNGSSCGAGSNVGNCYEGFNGTNQANIIQRSNRTGSGGESEGIKFQAQSNGKVILSGYYSTMIIVYVTSNF